VKKNPESSFIDLKKYFDLNRSLLRACKFNLAKATHMSKHISYGILFLFVAIQSLSAQKVETLSILGLDGPNGFALDRIGALYVANEPGKRVIRIVHDSIIEKVLDSDSPCGLNFDNSGNLYVINFFSGVVLRKIIIPSTHSQPASTSRLT
jgi:DNA-binding beta-propeller fold protein YncE